MYQLQCETRPGVWEDFQQPMDNLSEAEQCLLLCKELYPWFEFRIKP